MNDRQGIMKKQKSIYAMFLSRGSALPLIGSLFSLFLGAFLGAFLSYQFTVYLKAQETKVKREVLFDMLREELIFIGERVQPYEASKVIYRDPIRLSASSQLLDGEMLEYKKHGELFRALLKFQVAVYKYNDLVQTTNLIQNIPTISATAHRQIYENIHRSHQDVLNVRDEVIKQLTANKKEG